MMLDGEIALVTGAGRGIGAAISIALAREGAHVAAADIDGRTAEETSIAVKELGRRSLAIQADVGSLADIERMAQQTEDTLGPINILVNNAAVTRFMDIMDVTEEEWDRSIRVNAKGTFFCLQRVAREMIKRGGGRIINISSVAGKGYVPTSNAAYAASKGAVLAMTQIAAHQLGGYNINVNAICPGATRTAMSTANIAQRAESLGVTVAELERRRQEAIPINRFNDPEDIAAMAVFLAGPGARNITGQAINVDGGLVMH